MQRRKIPLARIAFAWYTGMESFPKGGVRVTIKDLSAVTGYSVGTISRVLNDQPNVSEKARTAILAAAQECGFQLNTVAKQLKQQHSNSILVVVKGTSNELFGSLVEAIQTRVAQTSHPLIVDYIDENSNEVLRAVQLCREKKPLGILFLGGNEENFAADFAKIGIPCVLVTNNAAQFGFSNLSSVSSDDHLASSMAIEHLISLGHKKIAVIGGDAAKSNTTKLRFQGCMDAFAHHGIAFDPERDYRAVRFSFADGFHAANDLLSTCDGFSAIFAMSDVMAIGAIRALNDAGKRVPEDVSVIGFDGLNIGEYFTPRLSTVAQDVDALAEQSVTLLLDHIRNHAEVQFITVPVTLLHKQSTRGLF